MGMAGGLGITLDTDAVAGGLALSTACFAETPSRYLLEVCPNQVEEIRGCLSPHTVTHIGMVTDDSSLVLGEMTIAMSALHEAWRGGLRL
jgi:phosphoribosylformylglycinamidine synthase